ncbi:MAG: LysM peptidoglycan-binding domain-containing protein [Curvibacter sp.]|nr:MAG: LysM peptidoglycan-binding domain-containing protein [Curvibacter sp.]
MIIVRITCLLSLALLTACASAPNPSSSLPEASSSATSTGSSAAPAKGNLDLQTSRELQRKPAASNNPQERNVNTAPLSSIDPQTLSSRTVMALSPPADLWERIRRGYNMPDLDTELVRDREQWYSSRPDYIFRMTGRSKKYLFHIVEELELRGMPTELALLPFIESAFNPQAVSSAKAAGMWQFMPATGKYFELKQNAFRDDRRDVLASTRAALDYLQKLHRMFGDWHLALAAYNWGEGSVARAIAKNKRAGLGTTYLDLSMPMETRFYVPKLQAVKNIVGNPAQFNSKLPLIENHPYFQTVTIQRDIDLTLAAKLAEVELADFKALNPSINRPVILAAGTPQILLPWDNAEVFQSNLEAYGSHRLASWTAWIAPTTLRPADVAKRVGMSESELRSINNIPPRVVIRAGSTLLVPRGANMADVTEKVADNGQLSLAPEVTLRRASVRAAKGETVASVARKYKLNAASVAEWNKVSTTASFKAGQQVVLFLPAKASSKTTTAKNRGKTVVAKKTTKSKTIAAKPRSAPVKVAKK